MIKSKYILLVAAVGVALFSSTSHAVRTQEATIIGVIASDDGGAFVSLSSGLDTTGQVCSANQRYQIDPAAAGSKALLATVLTARAAELPVQLDIPDCNITAPFISPTILNVILR